MFQCSSCGKQYVKSEGRCVCTNQWGTIVEVPDPSPLQSTKHIELQNIVPQELSAIDANNASRTETTMPEMDRVLGGGLVAGSVTLLGGEPGIGKSTLTLQIANNIAKNRKVLLISGEESIDQIAQRATRLKLKEKNLEAINEHNLETILETIKVSNTDFAIIDSIQVISSLDIPSQAGSVSQVRYCTEQIMELAKRKNIPIIIICIII